MYFTFNGSKFAINCDWLQYSVILNHTDPELRCPEGYRIELCQGTNVYQYRALVIDSAGRKELTLLWHPHSSSLNPLHMSVQVSNEFLYSGRIASSLDLVKEIVDCTFNSIGRFDVCCDFEADNTTLEFIQRLNTGRYYVEKKREGSAFWHEVKDADFKKKQLHCLSWGSKTSEIKVKLYNKSRELGLIGQPETDKDGNPVEPHIEKPWIVEEWKANDMDVKRIWRLEFSLKTGGQMRWNDVPIHLEQIASPSWLMRVYFDMYHTRFITRVNQGKRNGHKNLDDRVQLFLLPKDGERLKWAATIDHRTDSQPAVVLLRSLMRNFENDALMCNIPMVNEYIKTIQNVIRLHGLEEYFERSFGSSSQQFFIDVLNNAGRGVRDKIVSISKLID